MRLAAVAIANQFANHQHLIFHVSTVLALLMSFVTSAASCAVASDSLGMVLQSSAPLEQLGVFEIELANMMTELKFSVFNQVGDLLLMGTNQGMLLTFRFFPDGGMEVSGCGAWGYFCYVDSCC